jgi:CheY-like chemotaxis protein
MVKQVDLQLD